MNFRDHDMRDSDEDINVYSAIQDPLIFIRENLFEAYDEENFNESYFPLGEYKLLTQQS